MVVIAGNKDKPRITVNLMFDPCQRRGTRPCVRRKHGVDMKPIIVAGPLCETKKIRVKRADVATEDIVAAYPENSLRVIAVGYKRPLAAVRDKGPLADQIRNCPADRQFVDTEGLGKRLAPRNAVAAFQITLFNQGLDIIFGLLEERFITFGRWVGHGKLSLSFRS